MGGRECVGHLRADLGDLERGQCVGDVHRLGEAAGRQVLHDQPGLACLECDVVHRDGMAVGEFGGVATFPHGAFADTAGLVGVESGRRGDLFDGDVAVQQGVPGEPDRAHSTAAQFGPQAVSSGHQVFGSDAPFALLLLHHAFRLEDCADTRCATVLTWPFGVHLTGHHRPALLEMSSKIRSNKASVRAASSPWLPTAVGAECQGCRVG